MDYSSTGKINSTTGSHIKEKSVTGPYPVAKRIINQYAPKGNECNITFKTHPLSKSSGNQCRGNDGKFPLEHGEHIFRNTGIHDIIIYPFQKKIIAVPSKPASEN